MSPETNDCRNLFNNESKLKIFKLGFSKIVIGCCLICIIPPVVIQCMRDYIKYNIKHC